jgi:hypothetical protein
VAGIGHGERLARKWDAVAREYRDAFRRGEFIGIEPKVPGERFIQPDEARRDDGGGRQTRKQALRQPRVAVVEGEDVSCFSWGEHFVFRKNRQIVGAGNY